MEHWISSGMIEAPDNLARAQDRLAMAASQGHEKASALGERPLEVTLLENPKLLQQRGRLPTIWHKAQCFFAASPEREFLWGTVSHPQLRRLAQSGLFIGSMDDARAVNFPYPRTVYVEGPGPHGLLFHRGQQGALLVPHHTGHLRRCAKPDPQTGTSARTAFMGLTTPERQEAGGRWVWAAWETAEDGVDASGWAVLRSTRTAVWGLA